MSKIKLITVNIIVFLGLLFAVEGLSWVIIKLKNHEKKPLYEKMSYYQQQSWAKDYWGEHHKSFQFDFYPFVISRKKPFKGNYVNIDSTGVRYTAYNSEKKGAKKVFFMGGSTIYGTGSPDSLTIPSYFSKILHQNNADTAIVAYNFGESAWVIQQSLIQLIGELRSGNIPDFVVFYDGANDMYAALQNKKASSIQNAERYAQSIRPDFKNPLQRIWKLLKEKSYTSSLIELFFPTPKFSTLTPQQEQILAQDVIKNYFATYQLIEALAKSYNFKFALFWQPTLAVTQKKLGTYEKELLEKSDKVLFNFIKITTQQIEQVSNEKYPNFYLLHHALDTIHEDIFFDFVHITPQGNEVIAKKMVELLQKNR
jgi:lysophospholipase L1-like esterase